MLKKYIGDRAFYRRVMAISLPLIVQNAITNFVSMLDNLMVGQVGTLPMSGVAIGNQLLFVFNLCIFGACSGAGIFTAQFHGSGDEDGIRYTFRFKLLINSLLTLIGCSVFFLWGDKLVLLYLQGEGDPADAAVVCNTLKELRGHLPMFGVDLGHQLIAMSYGANITKMKFGHRGANHPVKYLENGKIEIVTQNHGYTVEESSLEGTPLAVTHRNLLDGTVAGIEAITDKTFSVQYQPDCAPESSSTYLFDKFIKMMEE